MRANLSYIVYRILDALVGRLPPRAGYWLAGWMGGVIYALMPTTRRIILHNLRHVLGPDAAEEEVEAVARRVFHNVARNHYEFFRLGRMELEEVGKFVTIEGREHLDRALAEGRGVIVVTGHLGNFDFSGQMALLYGVPLTLVAQHLKPERMFRFLCARRARLGLRLIPSDGPMMELFRALRRGEIIGLASDRDVIGSGRPVEFFGAPTKLPDGAVRIALRTGAALIPAFPFRQPDNTFAIKVSPPLVWPRTGNEEADVAAGMELVLEFLERIIGQYPEQWLLASPVWPMAQGE